MDPGGSTTCIYCIFSAAINRLLQSFEEQLPLIYFSRRYSSGLQGWASSDSNLVGKKQVTGGNWILPTARFADFTYPSSMWTCRHLTIAVLHNPNKQ
ncbi:hypothetical protein KXD40_005440 [Peronospora effusa]|uniref:Uncharacterized protein n=1 Tax=Peronospora effusa TaxID=542832 RepID=A0A3M6VNT0_9STRA|nr:hypothetical protein DD238_000567 [Peronospora effusa]UIZ27653.1 hypothetical protein KXD40_005440 [Peronospora effusa]